MILVTGGTGLSGRMTINEFPREKHPVGVLARSLAKASETEDKLLTSVDRRFRKSSNRQG